MTGKSVASETTHPVPHRPAPWTVKADAYLMALWLPSKLPEGIYDPLEASSPAFADPKEAGEFRGGIGFIMVVRYSDTPCGPYDELLIVPGNFSIPGQTQALRRTTRIYVSQSESCYNGRYNWNIPKHLARFTFTPPTTVPHPHPSHPLTVSVFPPSPSATTPFFTATLTPARYLPSFPFNTSYLPLSATMAQPPLPPAASAPRGVEIADRDAAPEVLVGTKVWRRFWAEFGSPRARVVWVHVDGVGEGEERKEAQRWWPVDARPWRVGVVLPEARIEISGVEEE